MFDSSLLRDTINQQIASGKRNFAIDLSALDYVYSDTINVLMGLNKRVLDVSGRLSLLAPQPEALQVLKRAGINNILRIFDTEADLIKTSEDIILQTTSYKVSDLQALANERPQSEFDQLRSEIGSVFGSQDSSGMAQEMPPKGPSQGMRPPVQPPIPKSVDVSPSVSDEFDQAFQQFEGFGDDEMQGFSQQQYIPPVQQPRNAPSFRQPPAQQPQFQGRQYVPPSPAPQTSRFDAVPKTPPRTGYIPPEPPKAVPPDFGTSRTETQRYQTVSGTSANAGLKMDQMPPSQIRVDDDTFDDFSIAKKGKKVRFDDDSLDSDDDFDSETKKKAPVGLIAAIFVILIVGGLIAYFALNQINSKPKKSLASKPATATPAVTAPQIPVDTTPKVSDTTGSASAAVVSEPPATPEVKKPDNIAIATSAEPPKPVTKPRPRPRTPAPRVSTPKPAATPAATNKVVITSVPSGASLEINGEVVGTTPYTWTKPVFGLVNVTARKSGYQENTISFDYTGGSTRESITLEKEYTPPPPPPVASTPRSYEPVQTPPPPPPPPVTPEPEPVLPPPPVSQPVASSGGDASIFIASIPPVADVFLNGKLIGKTNVSELKLPSGTHMLKFVKGSKETSKEVTVQTGKNPSQMVRLP